MRDVTDSPVALELELAPSRTVPQGVHQTIERAFQLAGLTPQWVPMRGDRSLAPATPRSAEASLHARIRGYEDMPPAELIAVLRAPLTDALATVRAQLADLPLGIETVDVKGRRRFFAFHKTDNPAAIRNGMDAIESAATTGEGVVGWDSAANVWRAL